MTHPFISILLLAAIAFAACGNSGDDGTAVFPNAPANPDKVKLLELVNNLRSKGETCGTKHFGEVPGVAWNDTLALVAKRHSQDMQANDKLSHNGSDGSFVNQRIEAAGYVYAFYAENLLKGGPSEEAAIEAWKASAAHCENMLDPNVREIGVGTAGPYWTMVLASH